MIGSLATNLINSFTFAKEHCSFWGPPDSRRSDRRRESNWPMCVVNSIIGMMEANSGWPFGKAKRLSVTVQEIPDGEDARKFPESPLTMLWQHWARLWTDQYGTLPKISRNNANCRSTLSARLLSPLCTNFRCRPGSLFMPKLSWNWAFQFYSCSAEVRLKI